MSDILVTNISEVLGPEFAKGLDRELRGYVEDEKVKVQLEQAERAKVQAMIGPQMVEGLGQKIASIHPRVFFRWLQEDKHFWQDPKNTDRFLKDNPAYAVKTRA